MKISWNKISNLTERRFGRLIVMGISGRNKHKQLMWKCKCDCDQIKNILGSSLVLGLTKSCGCLQKDLLTKHGMEKTRFYKIWHNIKGRCLNINDINYPKYGGSGISVCKRWFEFINFRDDMYESYLKHVEEFGEKDTTIDRFPNQKGNYEPSNCRWATYKEQLRNTGISTQTSNYDEHFHWKKILYGKINGAIKCGISEATCISTFGLNSDELKRYIEFNFKIGMTWDNYGKGEGTWQFDHILGINNFDLSKEENRKKCFHYTNLQPMWYGDHIKKSKFRK